MPCCRLDPQQARDMLLAKVKEDNGRIQAIDKQVKQIEEVIAQVRAQGCDWIVAEDLVAQLLCRNRIDVRNTPAPTPTAGLFICVARRHRLHN